MAIEFPDGEPNSPEEFQRMLTALLSVASENGIEVLGGWECRSDDEDWEAVIVSLERAD
jgi:hypothetical protein